MFPENIPVLASRIYFDFWLFYLQFLDKMNRDNKSASWNDKLDLEV